MEEGPEGARRQPERGREEDKGLLDRARGAILGEEGEPKTTEGEPQPSGSAPTELGDNNINVIPGPIGWLADAPLFIDEEQVSSFYDAVVRPDAEAGDTKLEFTEDKAREVTDIMNAKGGLSLGLGWIFSGLTGIDPKASVEVGGEHRGVRKGGEKKSTTITLKPIKTPQRQLVHLALHYLANQWQRLFLVNDARNDNWRSSEAVKGVPRGLVFLDLPGDEEANADVGKVTTKLIPMAAEFEQHTIVRMFDELARDSGENPPPYPVPGNDSPEEVRNYWGWFAQDFNPLRAMRVIEDAAANNKGWLRWVTYCVPINEENDTFSLRFSPTGKFDTGVFSYSLIWGGYKNGIRLVGTLKAGPELNVLAAYEK